MMTKFRPQIFLAMMLLGALGLYGLRLDAIEVVTAAVTGIGILAKDLIGSE
jgi:hydrogenase/urease accessory protein HupE